MHVLQCPPSETATSDLARVVVDAFRRIPHLPTGSIEWELADSTLVLRGRVARFHIKQLAQSVALRLPGIERVINEIEVESTGATSGKGPADAD